MSAVVRVWGHSDDVLVIEIGGKYHEIGCAGSTGFVQFIGGGGPVLATVRGRYNASHRWSLDAEAAMGVRVERFAECHRNDYSPMLEIHLPERPTVTGGTLQILNDQRVR